MLNLKAKLHLTKERALRKEHMRLQEPTFSPTGLPEVSTRPMSKGRKSLREPVQESPVTSFYQPYYQGMHSLKEVVTNYAEYAKTKAKVELLERRRLARQKTIYDVMEKDAQRVTGKAYGEGSKYNTARDGRKVETLVRKDAYDLSKKNLASLAKLLDKLKAQYNRSKHVT